MCIKNISTNLNYSSCREIHWILKFWCYRHVKVVNAQVICVTRVTFWMRLSPQPPQPRRPQLTAHTLPMMWWMNRASVLLTSLKPFRAWPMIPVEYKSTQVFFVFLFWFWAIYQHIERKELALNICTFYKNSILANAQTNESAFVVSWCRYFNNTRRMSKLMAEIKINPSKDFHNYKIEFAVKNEDSTSVSLFTVLRHYFWIPKMYTRWVYFCNFISYFYTCNHALDIIRLPKIYKKKNIDLQSTWHWEISFSVVWPSIWTMFFIDRYW